MTDTSKKTAARKATPSKATPRKAAATQPARTRKAAPATLTRAQVEDVVREHGESTVADVTATLAPRLEQVEKEVRKLRKALKKRRGRK